MNANGHSWWWDWLLPFQYQRDCFPFFLLPDSDAIMPKSRFPQHTLTIRCDSLTQASAPVVVGHYAQDEIVGAEALLDNSLQNRLSELASLGIYPSALGSSRIVLAPEQTPSGAVIMGLGTAGTLTAQGLQQAWLCTLLRYALHSHAPRNATGQLLLSCLLVGAQSPDLTVTAAIRALLNALITVQQRFQAELPKRSVPAFAIEWIEIDAYRALEASDTLLNVLQQEAFQGHFTLQQVVGALPTSLYALPVSQTSKNWWTRLVVTDTTLPANLQTISQLPESLQKTISQPSQLVIVFDNGSQQATYAWENLRDQRSQIIALQRGLVRQFIDQRYVRQYGKRAFTAILFCQYQTIPSPSLLAWQNLNDERYRLTTLLTLSADRVFCQLHHHAFELVHWQGEVQWNEATTDITFTLLEGEVCLADWQQVRQPPSLLVLALQYKASVPHIAWLKWVHALLALGIQGLVINQSNVTVSGRDGFLLPFYQALQTGQSLGNAIWQARQQQPEAWQVWQCYGNPDYYLL